MPDKQYDILALAAVKRAQKLNAVAGVRAARDIAAPRGDRGIPFC